MTLEWRAAELALLSGVNASIRFELASLVDQRIEQATRQATEMAIRNTDLAQKGGRIGIFDIDMATGDSFGSPMWAELLGQTRDTRSMTRRTWIKLLHPGDRDRVLASVASMVETGADTSIEYRIVLPSGEVRWLHSRNLVSRRSCDAMSSSAAAAAYGMLQDISERKLLEAQILRAAYHDELTGLPNRRFFIKHLSAACGDASRARRTCLAIYDLDFLKRANDQHGHDAGDVLLKTVADRLQDAGRDRAFVARIGGDEFALLLQTGDSSELRNIAERSLATLRSPVYFRGRAMSPAASAGGAVSASRATLASALYRQADQAMLYGKRTSKGNYVEHRHRSALRAP